MSTLRSRLQTSLLFVFTICAYAVTGQDARIALFDRYNHAKTYDDIKPLVSGELARQLELSPHTMLNNYRRSWRSNS